MRSDDVAMVGVRQSGNDRTTCLWIRCAPVNRDRLGTACPRMGRQLDVLGLVLWLVRHRGKLTRLSENMKRAAFALLLSSACTTLGPMPSTTGISAVPVGRPA